MSLKIYISSIVKSTPTNWHINLFIADTTAATVHLDELNVEVNVDNSSSVQAAKALIKNRLAIQKQNIIDREATRTKVQTVLTQIETEVGV